MIFSYPAKIKYTPLEKSYMVEFPDLPDCLTEGSTWDEEKIMRKKR